MSKYGDFITRKCKEMGISFGMLDAEADLGDGITSKQVRGKQLPSVVSLLKTMIALDLDEQEILELVDAMMEDARERGDIVG